MQNPASPTWLLPRPGRLAALAGATATGAAGLAYEVAWQRYLARMLGSDYLAAAVVLAVFLGGLSLGYWACGRLTLAVRRPLRAYALLEAGIGLWGLAFPAIFSLVYEATATWSFSPPLAGVLQGAAAAGALMLLPTAAMGATTPFLTRGLAASLEQAGRVHATVYAANTAGAFLGALAAGFFLIPAMGLPATVRLAAGTNLAVVLLFLLLPAPIPPRDEPASRSGSPTPPHPTPDWALYGVALLNGAYVMTLENALIRFTGLSLGSSSYAFAMIVAAFVLCIALGAAGVGLLPRPGPRALARNQTGVALLLAGLYMTLDNWPYWAHRLRILFGSTDADFLLFHAAALAALAAVLLLPVAGMGAAAPLVFDALKRDLSRVGDHSGRVFAVNTLGNLLGSLGGGVLLFLVLDLAGVFLAAAALAAASAVLAGWGGPRRLPAAAGVLALTLVLAALHPPRFDRSHFLVGAFRLPVAMPFSLDPPDEFFAQLNGEAQAVFQEDGPECSVAVLETPGEDWHPGPSRAIMVNAKSDSSAVGDAATLKLAAHLPALLARSRKDVLVIGLGTGVTAAELTLYPDVARIAVAEISPTVVRALPLFAAFTRGLGQDPRLDLRLGDAFHILAHTAGRPPEAWDLIISEPSNPWVTGVDLLFTREFYALVRDRLAPNGLLLQWMHCADASPEMLGVVLSALHQAFPAARVFMSQTNDLLILAAARPLDTADLDRARTAWAALPEVRGSLAPLGLTSLESLLLREIWPPALASARGRGYAPQSLDYPRLHYLAGRSRFRGDHLPEPLLYGPDSASCSRDYLLALARPGQPLFTADALPALLDSLEDVTRGPGAELPMARSLRLAAHLRDPADFPLSRYESAWLRPDLARLAMVPDQPEAAWSAAGLGDAPPGMRARTLLEHAARVRTHLAAYPLDGLAAVLRRTAAQARTPEERDWAEQALATLPQ